MEEPKKIKYFIDLDDTLLNSALIKRKLHAFLKALGFNDEERRKSYQEANVQGYEGLTKHLRGLAESYPNKLSPEDLEKAIVAASEYMEENLYKFLFPRTLEFLNGIDRNRYEVFLITVGDTDFQKAKAEGSGIAKFFDESHLIYTDNIDKNTKIREMLTNFNECFILLEDKKSTRDAVQGEFPNAIVLPAENGDLMKYIDPEALIAREGQVEPTSEPGNQPPEQQEPKVDHESPGPEEGGHPRIC